MHSYVVAQGDTLWLIAKRFGVSLEDMIKGNPGIKDPNKIAPGDRVLIPLPEDEGFMTYAVQNGDTMWSIARKFDLPRDILVRANETVENGDFLSPGCKLRIPAEKPDSAGLRYTVQPATAIGALPAALVFPSARCSAPIRRSPMRRSFVPVRCFSCPDRQRGRSPAINS